MARKSTSYKFSLDKVVTFPDGTYDIIDSAFYDIKEGYDTSKPLGFNSGLDHGVSYHLGLSKYVGKGGSWDRQNVRAFQGVDGKWYLPEDMDDSQTIPERIHRKLGELQGGEPMMDAIDEEIERLEAAEGEDLD